jgi:hypothetical protein
MSSNYGFEPTLDGLNNIDANNSTTENIICDTIQIDVSGTAPTRTAGDNTTNIANTQFVSSAISNAGANYVDLTSTQNISGLKTFDTVLPTSTITGGPFPSGTFATVGYVGTLITIERGNFKAANNAWTGTNTFNTNLPTSTQTPSTSTQLTPKNYVDSAITTGSSNLLAGTNAWTGTNTFNTNLPTSTLTPTTGNMLCNKTYVDSVSGGGVSLSGSNVWTGTNTFNTNLPTSTLTPTTGNMLCNKTYVDSVSGGASLGGSNVWTGTNTFNTNLPTSTLTPSTSTQLTPKNYVDSAITTGNSNLLASNNAFTGTNTFNTNLPTSTLTPSTSTQLTPKNYVDSAITTGSSSLLASNNVWTNENDFTNIVKIKDPTLATYAGIDFFSSITAGIVMNGAPSTTSALSGVNLNTNTLTVPIKNNQSLIRLRIPMNIAGFGVPSFYFGQLDIIFNSITAITILKNGSFYKTVSVFNLLNFTGTTKSWTGWSQKGENARAYLGDVQFELEITTANTSVDTYTIGIAVDVAVNAGAVGLITPRFLCTGDFNFTTTHATTSTGTTYISTDPASFFAYNINYGDEGNYIIGKGDTYVKTIQGGKFTIDALSQIDIESSGSNVNIKTGIDGGDLNLQSLGGSVNINTTGTLTTNIGIGGGTTNITGTTYINTSGTNNTAIGQEAGGVVSIRSPNVLINTAGTVNTNIGNTLSTTYLNGTTVQDINGTFNMMPTATIIQNVSATVPSGFLYCDGQAVNRVGTYARLFASIGTTFGVGNGSTTFNVPNFKGAFLRGASNQVFGGITYTAGTVGLTPQADAVLTPLYASNQGWRGAAAGTRECVSRTIITSDGVDTNTGILPRFDRTANENRPFNYAVYYYIRY